MKASPDIRHKMATLKYLFIHCTATPAGREVSAGDIRAWHTSPASRGGRGWKQVGYTDMFHLDGSVERLVDNNEDAQVDPWEVTNGARGYNGCSRHVVYVGGLDPETKAPGDTRTPEQLRSMAEYVRRFHARHPQVEIKGHNEVAGKDCPCFDVQEWLKQIGVK